MEYLYYTLSNGIRLVHRRVDSMVAHLALMINAGTRDEQPGEDGIAHFIEHVIFKGTSTRKVHQVLGRLENIGADLNAYTTKEETCIHASFLSEHYARALELFNDIIFNSTFPEKELEKEKRVVLDEINAYKDSPSELIFEDFESRLFAGHALEKPVLGKAASVRRITRHKVIEFIQRHYQTDQMVISSVGNVSFAQLVRQVERIFGLIPPNTGVTFREAFTETGKFEFILKKRVFQAHCIIGSVVCGYKDENRTVMSLLSNILGGPAMNSRLSMLLRERNGLSYNIESAYAPYQETGSFMIYLGTDNETLDKSIDLVIKEMKKFVDKPLGSMQHHIARQQFIGQLAIAFDSNLNDVLSMAKNILTFDRVDTHKELISKIETITAAQLQEVAAQVFAQDKMSRLIYKR
ncbi:MAG: pitrilysin family protein [Lentimicrobium sp.]|jgi:predicted Zn-dependent peptidase|nr:pitrilysin family protein [Lentimicrobium sp.]